MGFATPSFAHHLRNPFDVDLVFLMGGEHRDVEVADLPRLRKRLIRDGNDLQVIAWDDLGSFWKSACAPTPTTSGSTRARAASSSTSPSRSPRSWPRRRSPRAS